jgi:hypothetical protein
MTQAAVDLLNTLFNEISNNDHWTFDEQPMEGSSIDEQAHEIYITLPLDRVLKITVKEVLSSKVKMCPTCNKVKGGWPDIWANTAGKGLVYSCADCVAEYAESLKAPVVMLDKPPEAKHG